MLIEVERNYVLFITFLSLTFHLNQTHRDIILHNSQLHSQVWNHHVVNLVINNKTNNQYHKIIRIDGIGKHRMIIMKIRME